MSMTADAETQELDDFRAEVRAWIGENFPAALRDKFEEYYQLQPRYPDGADWKLWKDRVVAKGWGTPGWPKEVGGGGLPTPKARIVLQELADCGAFNPMTGMGTTMLGPTLLEYGSDEQKHDPPDAHLARRDALVPGLFGAGRRLRSRLAEDQGRGQGRSLPGQWPENLDVRQPLCRLVLLPGAHRPAQQA